MRIRALAAALVLLANPAQSGTTYYFRNVSTPPTTTTASPPPLQNSDAATGITVTVPCVACRARSGSQISFLPAASGTQGTVTWSLGSGALPSGGALAAGNGAVTGTAGSPGTSTFTLAVTDDRNQPVPSQAVTFQVIAPLTVSYAGSSGISGRSLTLSPVTGGLIGPASYVVSSSALPSG